MEKYHLTQISGNTKTGPIPVSMTTKDSCPDSCKLKGNGCYAELGHIKIHWDRVGERGVDLEEFCEKISRLPRKTLWRHNQAGDLPGQGDNVDSQALAKIVEANSRRNGFTYTHKPVGWNTLQEIHNASAITDANQRGFTINLSANNLEEADTLARLGAGPVVTVINADAPRHGKTPQGRHYVVCPASEEEGVTCASCGLCAIAKRKAIIAFRVHGIRKKHALRVFQGN